MEDWVGGEEGRAAEMVERVRRVVSREIIRATGIMSEGRLIEVGSLRERDREREREREREEVRLGCWLGLALSVCPSNPSLLLLQTSTPRILPFSLSCYL